MRYRFPQEFVWGAGTSSYQVEGSPLADGAGPSIQHGWSHTPGNVADGSTGDVVADHYRRWRDDVALMREIGLQSYQFSMSWARILPDGTGRPNRKALDFYDALVDSLLQAGVAPAPLLYVWEMPAELEYRGGWANRDSAEWFAEFASLVYELIGDRATHWLTICEPTSVAHYGYISGELAPGMNDLHAGLRAAHHISLAHGRAVQAFRASGAKGWIGCDVSAVDAQPASDSEADAAAAARVMDYYLSFYLDPVLRGSYPASIEERLASAWPEIRDGDLEVISTPIDYIGITYYSGFLVADGAVPTERVRGEMNTGVSNVLYPMLDIRLIGPELPKTGGPGFSWSIHPQGVKRVLRWLRDRYGDVPLVVAENGAAYPDVVADGRVHDAERTAYIREHLIAAHEAIEEGIDLRGWFVWSLLDTWEFMVGLTARFGLVHVDYETLARTVKDSGWWFRDVMANNGFD